MVRISSFRWQLDLREVRVGQVEVMNDVRRSELKLRAIGRPRGRVELGFGAELGVLLFRPIDG